MPSSGLRLTIQADIQWEAEHECALQVARHQGEELLGHRHPAEHRPKILALAQYPTFNPGKPIASLAQTRTSAVASVFAPGSTAKVITAAAAFQYAGQTPLTSYVVPDAIFWHGAWYHDAEPHPTQRYTIAGIIAHSLNDGMVQVADHVTPAEQYAEFRAFGLGSTPGSDLPGESPGLLRPAIAVDRRLPQRALPDLVRPERRRHRHADGQRIRDDRQRRRPGAADDRSGAHGDRSGKYIADASRRAGTG